MSNSDAMLREINIRSSLGRQTTTWGEASFDARLAFIKAMLGCQYGDEPLLDAWSWFLTGWNARDKPT